MEVQALAALGSLWIYFCCQYYHLNYPQRLLIQHVFLFILTGPHENVVGYYSSWFENEHLYIQMELCDHSLSNKKYAKLFSEVEVLEAMYQVRFLLESLRAIFVSCTVYMIVL